MNPFSFGSSDDSALNLHQGEVIRERFRVMSKVGEGGFGAVYNVFDLKDNQSCAMKIESNQDEEKDQLLKVEMNILLQLQGKKHICRYIASGTDLKFNFLVMSLAGKSLSEVRKELRTQKFSVGTTCRLAKQCLVAVEDLHNIGYVHRDLKPSNFAMGRHDFNKNSVIMFDFGLARRFVNESGEIRSPRDNVSFRGTRRYASISGLRRVELGRVDDIWCLFYMFIEMIKGSLPWKDVEKKKICEFKESYPLEHLLDQCPSEFLQLHEILSTYTYVDKPNYVSLKDIFDSILNREGIKEDDLYDWEVPQNLSLRRRSSILRSLSLFNSQDK